jgi:hypothetical protein
MKHIQNSHICKWGKLLELCGKSAAHHGESENSLSQFHPKVVIEHFSTDWWYVFISSAKLHTEFLWNLEVCSERFYKKFNFGQNQCTVRRKVRLTACNVHGSEGHKMFSRVHRRKWEDNIKIRLKEIGREDVNWIHLAQNRHGGLLLMW